MTFCIGIKVDDGLVAVADTRISSGTEVTRARKISLFQGDGYSMFVMTSGLRSLRDKAITYFGEVLYGRAATRFEHLYEAVNAFTEQLRRVAAEDKHHLVDAGLRFDLHCLMGGQMHGDPEHKLFLVYPEGNWVEIGPGTPYQIIGNSNYGQPFLNRALRSDDSVEFALKAGCIAFDSTRISVADVDFPIDVAVCMRNSFHTIEHRFEEHDLVDLPAWWAARLRESVSHLPGGWIEALSAKIVNDSVLSVEQPKQ